LPSTQTVTYTNNTNNTNTNTMPSQLQLMQLGLKAKAFLNSIGDNPYERDERGETVIKGQGTDSLVDNLRMSLLNVIAVGAIVAALVTMLITTGWVVTTASVLLLAFGPLIMVQKCKLNSLGGMRGQLNMLRASANEFSAENDKLHGSVNVLEGQVASLKGVEKDLELVAMEAGAQVGTLVSIVEQNGELQGKIKSHLEAEVMQTILTAVLTVDKNEDFTLDARELRRLEMRLSNLPAIEFDKKNFEKYIGHKEMSLDRLMQVLRNLTNDDVPETENIFHFHPEQLKKKD